MTYGDVAHHLGISSARIVGKVLATRGGTVAWHRVVLSTGGVAAHLEDRQLSLLRDEGVDVRRGRVDLRRHRWNPTSP
jgi:alkylated DNA nucleotide flippase Atl1